MRLKMVLEDKNIVWTRTLACLLVVLVHTAEQWLYMYGADHIVFHVTSFFVLLGIPAVPLFFMISGYLLFSKEDTPSADLVWKRFHTIFRPLFSSSAYTTSIRYSRGRGGILWAAYSFKKILPTSGT